ncbi:JAB1/Mov34/MPN/PAD-1 ubiquitin protease-domain-containing protein [Umbelopsis sp. AD052]|nr:JAB1/Mov34/MPN/PAD-1 ubiquitin protease-domain-containing protein [Umbelopsis sp. AD052]
MQPLPKRFISLETVVHYFQLLLILSTDVQEEIIGVLLGNWQPRNASNPFARDQSVAVVEAVCILTRSDKRKDRVEISPIQLHLAVVEAEKIEKELGRQICVVGWYHSHPHITVFPSHIGKCQS